MKKEPTTSYCESCKRITIFDYVGEQHFPKREDSISMYNCRRCHTTRILDLNKLEEKLK